MLDAAEDFLGRVTFITGPGKHCGKTTFMNRAAELARRGARLGGLPGPALLTVGYDGEARDYMSGARKPGVPVCRGDIVVTNERFARCCLPEIVDLVPGSTALGRLCLARAGRAGTVALVGAEGNSLVAWSIRRILDGGLGDTVLVDGAINRLTQVASIPEARFVYAMRVDRVNLDRSIAQVRRIFRLVNLPVVTESEPGLHDGSPAVLRLDDALTAETAARLPASVKTIIVEDFTKIFLDATELAAFERERQLKVERSIGFAGFVVACRGVSDGEFISRIADETITPLITFNPYESAVGRLA